MAIENGRQPDKGDFELWRMEDSYLDSVADDMKVLHDAHHVVKKFTDQHPNFPLRVNFMVGEQGYYVDLSELLPAFLFQMSVRKGTELGELGQPKRAEKIVNESDAKYIPQKAE